MKKRSWPIKAGIMLTLLLFVFTGCQAVGGVDLNKSLLSMFSITSMEGSGTLTLDFNVDDKTSFSGMSDGEMAVLSALNHAKLNLERIKQESPARISIHGSFDFSRGKIPFDASITPQELVLKPEGAIKPIVLSFADVTSLNGLNAMSSVPMPERPIDPQALEALAGKLKDPEFMKPVYSYVINGLPNPQNIKVDTVSDTINGEALPLFKVQSELSVSDLVPWMKKFILNLMQNDEGLKAAVGQLYDAFLPVLTSLLQNESESSKMDPNPILTSIGSLLQDRTTAVEILHTEAKQVMVILLVMLNGDGKGKDYVHELFDDKTGVKANIYVDQTMKVRKSETEWTVVPRQASEAGFTSLKLTTSFTNWNVNQNVKADILSSEGGFTPTAKSSLLDNLDKKSVLYQWLLNDLHAAQKKTGFFMLPYQSGKMRPYVKDGVAMVPARQMAERLDCNFAWDGAANSVTITEKLNGKTITASLNNKTAIANGHPYELDVAAELRDGTFYVPARSAAEALGAKVEWDNDTKSVRLTLN